MSDELHPPPEMLGRFVAGSLGAGDSRNVVRHLLSGCSHCRRQAGELWQPRPAADLTQVVARARGRAVARQASIAAERDEAAKLLAELEEQAPTHRLLMVLNSRRYCNWFLCETLIQRAFEAGFSDPAAAVSQAEVAVALADRLLGTLGDEPVNRDLVARSWAVLGNARRIQSDLPAAEEALQRAVAELERGSGDPVEESTLARFLGSLRREQRRFDESLESYDRAYRLARAAGDSHLAGRALLDRAVTLGESGEPEKQIEGLRRAVELLDGERDLRLLLAAQHNLTWALKESGRLDEALAALQELLPLHARSGKPMDLLRLRWLEGKLAQAQGELARAEKAFREVCDGLLERRVGYDAALASLDLAAVLCEQRRFGEMKTLAAESLPIFHALGVHREALAALALFQQAVEHERISLRFIAELADYLQRSRSDPALAFRPPE